MIGSKNHVYKLGESKKYLLYNSSVGLCCNTLLQQYDAGQNVKYFWATSFMLWLKRYPMLTEKGQMAALPQPPTSSQNEAIVYTRQTCVIFALIFS